MSGIYYVDLVDVLADVGVHVAVGEQNEGWETRARSSGGFPSAPLGITWHHTASQTSIANDLSWQCHGCDDAPVGNMTIDRDGVVWPVAAGASNCAGAGGPAAFSRGVVPVDSGNTRTWNIEVANNGVGEPWPIAQLNVYFVASNALNAWFGNQPTDVQTHAAWTNYTRKIDPATAAAVAGSWQPDAVNSSGTWNLDDIRAECAARAGAPPEPPPQEDAMSAPAVTVDNTGATWIVWSIDGNVGAKCDTDPAFGLGAPDDVKLTTDVAVVAWGDGLVVSAYAVDGGIWMRYWRGRSHDWDDWWSPS